MDPPSNFLRIGDVTPDFVQDTTLGSIQFHDYINNSWAILFSHPRAFTPVCTTELCTLSQMEDEFAKRNTKILALSCDSVEANKAWIKDIEDITGKQVDYPIICDEDRHVCERYNMLSTAQYTENPTTVRSVFLIAQDKTIKLMMSYPPTTGRNFDEILRALDSLQLTTAQKLATPANWNLGEKCVLTGNVKESVNIRFGHSNIESVKPYLNYVDPEKLCIEPQAVFKNTSPLKSLPNPESGNDTYPFAK